MGSKGKGQTIGYKYYLGLHFVVAQSPIDFVGAIKFQDKIAWTGFLRSGRLSINEPNLFGGEHKEGGVSGTVDVLDGSSTQTANDYLQSKAPPSGFAATISAWLQANFPIFFASRTSTSYSIVPAFRGLFSLVFRQVYIGNNPYLKPIRFRARNIFQTFGAWHPEIAPINAEATHSNTAFYIAIDTSMYMLTRAKLAVAVEAVATYLASLKGTTGNSVHIVAFSSAIDSEIERLNCTDADYDALIAWVNGLTSVTGFGCDWGAALGSAAAFFTAANPAGTSLSTALDGSKFFQLLTGDSSVGTSTNDVILFISDGTPSPYSSLSDAITLLGGTLAGKDVFCYNVIEDNSADLAYIDNTDWDGIPILGKSIEAVFTDPPPGAPGGPPVVYGVSPEQRLINLESVLNMTGAEIDAIAAAGATVKLSQAIWAELNSFGGGPTSGNLVGSVQIWDETGTKIFAPEGSGAMSANVSFNGGGAYSLTFTLPVGARTLSYGSAYSVLLPLYTDVYVPNGFFGIFGQTVVPNNALSPIGGSFDSFVDINPAHVLRDLILNPVCGGNNDASTIGTSFYDSALTLFNENFGISIINASPSSRDNFKQEIERTIDGRVYFDETTGKWELKLIRADYVLGDLHTIDGSTIEDWPEPPTRPQPEELPNQVTVVYTNREDGSTLSYTVTNTAAVQEVGVVIPEKKQYLAITVEALARFVAGRDLASITVPLYAGAVRVSYLPQSVNIGSAFILNDPRVGISNLVCRVTELDEGDTIDNSVLVRFTEDTYGRQITDTTTEVSTTTTPDKSPAAPTVQLVEETPYWALVMQSDQTTIDQRLTDDPGAGYMMGTCDKPNQYHTNAVIARLDGANWTSVGAASFAPYAVLSANLSAAADATTFDVAWDDSLAAVKVDDLLQIDSEIMRVDNMTLSGSVVTVTVGRGVLDTVPAFHASGAKVIVWWQFGGSDGVEYTAGESITYRMLPQTSKGPVSVDSIASEVLTFDSRAQRPYAVGKFQIGGSYLPATVLIGAQTATWAHRDRTIQTTTTPLDFTAASIGPESGDAYYTLRRTVQVRPDLFALTDIFDLAAVPTLFLGGYGTEYEVALSPAQTTTTTMSADDIDLFGFTDIFAQSDFYIGAFLPSTMRLQLGVRVRNGTYTNWQDATMLIEPLLPVLDLTATEVV